MAQAGAQFKRFGHCPPIRLRKSASRSCGHQPGLRTRSTRRPALVTSQTRTGPENWSNPTGKQQQQREISFISLPPSQSESRAARITFPLRSSVGMSAESVFVHIWTVYARIPSHNNIARNYVQWKTTHCSLAAASAARTTYSQ